MKESLIIGKRYQEKLEKPLAGLGIDVFWIDDNPDVDIRLAGHADLSAINLGKSGIVIADYLMDKPALVNLLTNAGSKILTSEKKQSMQYPEDVNLCACIIGNKIIHNPMYTDNSIMKNFKGEFIPVKQGYSKCMICIVDSYSIITSDSGIAGAAANNGISVLKIQIGGIRLEGFNYGFIGGASVSLKDSILLTGSIDKHPDRDKIHSFIESRGKELITLTDEEIYDIGGAVIIEN